MTDQTIILSLSLLLWTFLGYRFIRALKNRKITNGASVHAWAIYFLLYLVAILSVDPIEQQIDPLFDMLPMTAFLRSLVLLATSHLFFLGIRHVLARPQRLKQGIVALNIVAIAVCIGLFSFFASTRLISMEKIGTLIKAVRDVMMILWTTLIFIPFAIRVWRDEHVRVMKMRRVIELVFFGTFLITCLSGLAWSVSLFYAPEFEPYVWALDRSFVALCYVLLLVLLVPYRWLMPLFYPKRLMLYLQLQRLETAVQRHALAKPTTARLAFNLTHPDEIELAIYQKTIRILDMYPSMIDTGERLQKKIQAVVDAQQQYDALVQRMAGIRL